MCSDALSVSRLRQLRLSRGCTVALHCATDVASIRCRRCSIRVEKQMLTLTAQCVNFVGRQFGSANTDVISEVSKQRVTQSQTRRQPWRSGNPLSHRVPVFKARLYCSQLVNDIKVARKIVLIYYDHFINMLPDPGTHWGHPRQRHISNEFSGHRWLVNGSYQRVVVNVMQTRLQSLLWLASRPRGFLSVSSDACSHMQPSMTQVGLFTRSTISSERPHSVTQISVGYGLVIRLQD